MKLQYYCLLLVLLSGCHAKVAPPALTLSQTLTAKEGMYLGCGDITSSPDAPMTDCQFAYDQWNEFKERYAVAVDPAARDVKMGEVSWLGVKPTITANGIPRFNLGVEGMNAQAYFSVAIVPIVVWANPYSIGCEALHFLHWRLHGSDLRPVELQDPAAGIDKVYQIIGHGTPDDPMHFECWKESEARTLQK